MAVLQGDIQVGEDLGVCSHGFDEFIGDIPGIGVHDADPVHLRHFIGHALEELGKPVFQTLIMTIVGGVLGDQNGLT